MLTQICEIQVQRKFMCFKQTYIRVRCRGKPFGMCARQPHIYIMMIQAPVGTFGGGSIETVHIRLMSRESLATQVEMSVCLCEHSVVLMRLIRLAFLVFTASIDSSQQPCTCTQKVTML